MSPQNEENADDEIMAVLYPLGNLKDELGTKLICE